MSRKAKPPASERNLGTHYIRHWREHRRLTQDQVVARMEKEPGGDSIISKMSLSRIERGEQPYSEEVLNALSHALGADPWELISVNPAMDGQVIDLMRFIRDLPAESAPQALRILRAALT